MNEIEIFKNEEFGEVRTIEKNSSVLFCGSDIAKALGYADTAKAIKQHCKEDGWVICPVIDSMGRANRQSSLQRVMFTDLSHIANYRELNALKDGYLMKFCPR